MDFSKISLYLSEIRTLKRSQTCSVPIDKCQRLKRYHLVTELTECVPGYQPKPTGKAVINDAGSDYLAYRAQKRREFWKEHIVNFVGGFISGVLATIAVTYLTKILSR